MGHHVGKPASANVYFIIHYRLLNSNSLTTVKDDAFSGLSHLEYL